MTYNPEFDVSRDFTLNKLAVKKQAQIEHRNALDYNMKRSQDLKQTLKMQELTFDKQMVGDLKHRIIVDKLRMT